jgi:hypothetical protein
MKVDLFTEFVRFGTATERYGYENAGRPLRCDLRRVSEMFGSAHDPTDAG